MIWQEVEILLHRYRLDEFVQMRFAGACLILERTVEIEAASPGKRSIRRPVAVSIVDRPGPADVRDALLRLEMEAARVRFDCRNPAVRTLDRNDRIYPVPAAEPGYRIDCG